MAYDQDCLVSLAAYLQKQQDMLRTTGCPGYCCGQVLDRSSLSLSGVLNPCSPTPLSPPGSWRHTLPEFLHFTGFPPFPYSYFSWPQDHVTLLGAGTFVFNSLSGFSLVPCKWFLISRSPLLLSSICQWSLELLLDCLMGISDATLSKRISNLLPPSPLYSFYLLDPYLLQPSPQSLRSKPGLSVDSSCLRTPSSNSSTHWCLSVWDDVPTVFSFLLVPPSTNSFYFLPRVL